MSYLLLDNCHHSHCCHGNYTEIINQMMKTINTMKTELDNLKVRESTVKVTFKTTWEGTIIENHNPLVEVTTLLVGKVGYGDDRLTVGVQNRLQSKSVTNIDETLFNQLYNSSNCRLKIKNGNYDCVFTKCYSNSGTLINFIGGFVSNAINGTNFRVSLSKGSNSFSISWYTIYAGAHSLDDVLAKGNEIDFTFMYSIA